MRDRRFLVEKKLQKNGWAGLDSAQSGMQVGDQRVHLLLSKAAGEGGHHSLAGKNHPTHLDIGCGSAAGESCPAKDCVQVRWRLLKRQVVLLVAVGAAAEVQVLPCYLLPG